MVGLVSILLRHCPRLQRLNTHFSMGRAMTAREGVLSTPIHLRELQTANGTLIDLLYQGPYITNGPDVDCTNMQSYQEWLGYVINACNAISRSADDIKALAAHHLAKASN